MARLERNSLTRWENGVPKTYFKGDDVPDLRSSGVTGVFLTREEGGKTPTKTKTVSVVKTGAESDTDLDSDLDILNLLEGNVRDVVSHIGTEERIEVLENILVAEGEGKNRSTVTTAINDRIKALEEADGGGE